MLITFEKHLKEELKNKKFKKLFNDEVKKLSLLIQKLKDVKDENK